MIFTLSILTEVTLTMQLCDMKTEPHEAHWENTKGWQRYQQKSIEESEIQDIFWVFSYAFVKYDFHMLICS